MAKQLLTKLFVVRKYIIATSAEQAIKKEKEIKVDDCYVHEASISDILNKENAGFKKD